MEIIEKRRWRKQLENHSNNYDKQTEMVEAPICSFKCFYWDDCEFEDGGNPCVVRHLEPVLRQNLPQA